MLLAEKLLLLSLTEKGGFASSEILNYVLAGAVSLDLTVMGRIETEKEKIFVIDNSSTGFPFLDTVLAELDAAKRPQKITKWIQKLATHKKIRQPLIDHFVHIGRITVEDGRFLGLFPYKRYNQTNYSERDMLVKHLREAVLNNEKIEESTIMLLSLVKAGKLVNHLFNSEDRRLANKRITQLTKDQEIGKAVSYTISAIQTAVIAAIAVSASNSSNK